jgi:transcriptional regulator with XRE-family HTH domain
MSLEALAAKARVSSGTLGRLERGDSDPTLGTLLRLMRALELHSVEELLGDMPSSKLPIS